jgi:hypothetical protein
MSGMVKNKSPDAVLVALRSSGLAYPGAHIKSSEEKDREEAEREHANHSEEEAGGIRLREAEQVSSMSQLHCMGPIPGAVPGKPRVPWPR